MPTGLQLSWVKNKLNFRGKNKKKGKKTAELFSYLFLTLPLARRVWSLFFLTTDTAESNSVSSRAEKVPKNLG